MLQKQKHIVLFFIYILFSISVFGNELFLKANDAYNEKKYAEAAALYEELIKEGYKDAVVCHNLGNAYFKNDQLAKALLWYERALRLDPANEDIKHNISFVNQLTIDKMDVKAESFLTKWFCAIRDLFSVKIWSILSIVFIVICCLCIVLIILVSSSHWRISFFIISCVAVVFAVLSIVFAVLQKNNINREDEAIIMAKILTVKSTPDTSGTSLFTVHEGIKVQIIDNAGNWVEIRFPDGNKGWIIKDAIEVI